MEICIMEGPEISALGRDYSCLMASDDPGLNIFLILFRCFHGRGRAEGGVC